MARYADHLIHVIGETRTPAEVVPKARALLAEAVALNPGSSEAHTALGTLYMQVDRDGGRAEAEYRQAIELNPSDSKPRLEYAWLLRVLQRFQESREPASAAWEQDPLSYLARISIAHNFGVGGDLASALPAVEKLVEDYPDNPVPRTLLAQNYCWSGRLEEARKALGPVAGYNDLLSRATRAVVRALLGDPSEARSYLSDWETGRVTLQYSAARAALLYAAMGEKDRAPDLLKQDDREGPGLFWSVYQSRVFDEVRSDARFVALLRAQKLPTTLGRALYRRPPDVAK